MNKKLSKVVKVVVLSTVLLASTVGVASPSFAAKKATAQLEDTNGGGAGFGFGGVRAGGKLTPFSAWETILKEVLKHNKKK
jgi:hypothetical protein